MSELSPEDKDQFLNVYRNVLVSLVLENNGEMLVKLTDIEASLMWKLEVKDSETYVRFRVVIDNGGKQ
jgi:hypothetical protein